ncbi:uncharacterized protein PG998_002960 [Apiospora kogelbergensis]|uniref:uncharacterized protein n=1 Tax=Apiospora kogelbergensis TaxID=1337665 RepID=UPI00312FD80C
MTDRECDDLPQSAALWELYNRKRALESKQEKKNDLAKEVEALAKEEEVLEKEAARVAQKRRIVDAKCKTRRAELAQVSAGCESEKADLQRSWRYMFGGSADRPSSQHPSDPLPTSDDESSEDVLDPPQQSRQPQTHTVENAARSTNNQPPAATRTGRISRPPPRYSPTLRATNSTRASPYVSANNGRAAVGQLASQPSYRTVVDDTPANSRSKRNQQRREEDPELSGHVQKKRKTAAATPKPYTIDFADVFQEGFAQHKHMIIQYPPGSAISNRIHSMGLRTTCEQQSIRVPSGTLDIDMSEWPVRWASTIKKMGLRVLNCDATKAEKNNAAFTQALDAGYKPLGPDPNQQPTLKETHQIPSRPWPALREEVATDTSRPTTRAESEEREREVITQPLEGKPYLGYWRSGSRGQGWYALIVLPLGSFSAIGLHGSFLETELTKSVPACYERQNGAVLQWAEGYRDGERLANKRQFPVMWFHDAQTFSLCKDLMIPDPVWYNWLQASDLRPLSSNCESGGNKRPRGYSSALEYASQLDRIKAARHHRTAKTGDTQTQATGPLPTKSVAGDTTEEGHECGRPESAGNSTSADRFLAIASDAKIEPSQDSSENEDWDDMVSNLHRRYDERDESKSCDGTIDYTTDDRLRAASFDSSLIEGQHGISTNDYDAPTISNKTEAVNPHLEDPEDIQRSADRFAIRSSQQPLPSELLETAVPSLLTIGQEAPHLVSASAPPNGSVGGQEQAYTVRTMGEGHLLPVPRPVLAQPAAIALDRASTQQQSPASVNPKTGLRYVLNDASHALLRGGAETVATLLGSPGFHSGNNNHSGMPQTLSIANAPTTPSMSNYYSLNSRGSTRVYQMESFHPLSQADSSNVEHPEGLTTQSGHKTKQKFCRTKTGCLTCRRRRKKCDEQKPECNNCLRAAYVDNW